LTHERLTRNFAAISCESDPASRSSISQLPQTGTSQQVELLNDRDRKAKQWETELRAIEGADSGRTASIAPNRAIELHLDAGTLCPMYAKAV